jgi:hypothetical protein
VPDDFGLEPLVGGVRLFEPLFMPSIDGMVDGRGLLNNELDMDFRRHNAQGFVNIDT